MYCTTNALMRRLSLFLLLTPAALHGQSKWMLAETVRYGDARPEATIADAGPLVVAGDGMVYAAQVADGTVLMFDASGAYLKTIGHRGEGPGEFVRPTRAGLIGDTLWVSDAALQRVSFFQRNGTFIRSQMVVFDVRDPFLAGEPTTLLKDGSAVTMAGVGMHLVKSGSVNRLPLLKHERDGKVLDTLRWVALSNMTGSVSLQRGGAFVFRQPFADGPLVVGAADGSGLIVVDRTAATAKNAAATFTVTRFGSTGTLAYTKRVAYQPTSLPERQANVAIDAIAKPKPGGPPITRAAVERSFYRPLFLPPVTDAVLAADGSVWLRGEDTDSPTVLYRVLDLKGTLTATVTLPRHLTIRHATTTDVWAFGTEHDAPYLARFRIVK
jgi:hypothetical protein